MWRKTEMVIQGGVKGVEPEMDGPSEEDDC